MGTQQDSLLSRRPYLRRTDSCVGEGRTRVCVMTPGQRNSSDESSYLARAGYRVTIAAKYELLATLTRQPGRVFTRAQLLTPRRPVRAMRGARDRSRVFLRPAPLLRRRAARAWSAFINLAACRVDRPAGPE